MTAPASDQVELGFSRLLLVCTGSAAASTIPQWLDWLTANHPTLAVTVVLTRTAERFVTREAVAARGVEVAQDTWPEGPARHVVWAEWAEAIVVYPATMHFLARLASGLADSPALLAVHCSSAPVAVVPALPPGGLDSPVLRRHWAELADDPRIVLVPPVLARSLTTGRVGAWGPPSLNEVLRAVSERRAELAGADKAPASETYGTVAAFGTGLLRTTVYRDGDGGYRWHRTPGPAATTPFRDVSAGDAARLAEIGARGGGRLVLGEPLGAGRIYQVRGGESVAARLLRGGPAPELVEPVRDLGRLLRAVHDCAPAGPAAPSPGLLRLGDWLAGRARHPYPAVVREMLRRGLGEERWRRVTDWYRAILADPKVTLAHGAPGLGALVIGGEVGTSDLLTGEDLAAQPWYVDLGWVVGELAELKWQAGGDTAAWQALTDALFDGYGRDLGDTWHRMVVLRILLHSHDFAAYAGGLGDWVDRYAGFLIYLVDLS